MKITCLEITDYKRVRKVAITPDADASIVLIAGKNGAGKSSTLDALTAAFGGAKSVVADPVRHGASTSTIYVELDDGKITIERTIQPDGKTTLHVRDAEGSVRSPQALLDRLVGTRFLDPLAFLALAPKDQRAALMKLIPDAARIEDLNGKRQRAFDRRTELGRDLDKAKGELARLPEVPVGKPIDVAALVADKGKLADQMRMGDGLGNAHKLAMRATTDAIAARDSNGLVVAAIERRISDLEGQLECERRELAKAQAADLGIAITAAKEAEAAAKAKLDAAVNEWSNGQAARDKLDAALAGATEHNRAIAHAEAQNARRVEASAAVAKHEAETKELTGNLAKIEERKAAILAAAKLPVEGLAIGEESILFNGVAFGQASGSEKLRVSLALALAASPDLDDVWIRDAALLDDDSLDLVAKQAATAGRRVWLERVGTRDPGAIVISDGQVVS